MAASSKIKHKTAGENIGDEEKLFSPAQIKVIIANNLVPPEGNKDLGRRIFVILDEILKDKESLGLLKKWNKYYEWSKNKHWKKNNLGGSPLISANLLYSHREKNVSLLTDKNPTFDVVPIRGQNAAEEEMAESKKPKSRSTDLTLVPRESLDGEELEIHQKLHRTADYWWRDTEQQSVLEKSVSEAETYGCIVEKVSFDPTLESGLGEVVAETIAPYWFGVYPTNAMDSQKAEANVHFKLMTIREARRTWPEMADKIQSDTEILRKISDDRRDSNVLGGDQGKYHSTFSNIVKTVQSLLGGKADATKLADDYTVVVEFWVKDYTVNDLGEPKYKGNIRCITACNGGEVILSDRDNPSITTDTHRKIKDIEHSYLWDKFPFSLTPSIWDPGYIWGMSDFEQLQGLQKEVDKTLSQLTLIKDKTARLKFSNPKDSGVTNEELDNSPSIINPTNAQKSEGMGYINPPAFPIDLHKSLEVYIDLFRAISGSFLLEQAQGPGRDVIAFKALAALLEQANIMLKRKVRNYDKMVRIRGRMYLSLVLNFYTEDRWISYKDSGEDRGFFINALNIHVPMKLLVVSGSTMPVSKVQEREEAVQLYKAGVIDIEEVLKRMDWPDWKEVVKRMQAGPFGIFLDKLAAAGFPPEMLSVFKAISEMNQKDFLRAMKNGEVPDFQQILLSMAQEVGAIVSDQGAGGEMSPEDRVQQADALLKLADVELKEAQAKKIAAEAVMLEVTAAKTKADIDLVEAKTATEFVDQHVKMAGVEFDGDKLKIERAKAVEDVKKRDHDETMQEAQVESQLNKDAAEVVSKLSPEGGGEGDSSLTKAADEKGQGPHRERGLQSNNEDL